MHPKRLRAPSEDGAILQDPPLAEALNLFRKNAERMGSWSLDLQGRSAEILRAKAREEAVSLARAYHAEAGLDPVPADASSEKIVATGHQPELFHPGVWVKNFALGGIARTSGALGLNLIVDNDIPKGPSIRVPSIRGDELYKQVVAFDIWPGELPYESQTIQDFDRFSSFGDRVKDALEGLISDPLIDRFWPIVMAVPAGSAFEQNVGLRFARARRLIEAEWGVKNLEVPLSKICESDAFLWFVSHILANLPRFRDTHNQSLFRYRKLYGIRSKNHPVAALRTENTEWQEAPFWIWRDSTQRRQGLWIRAKARSMDLRIGGEDEPFLEIPLASDREACCAVEALQTLPGLGIRLRTRALTTTMFARLFLSDLFLHGIGGAKYDELGDEIVKGFYGIEPPRFLTLSLTLHVGIPSTRQTEADLHQVESGLRAVAFNPDRSLQASDQAEVQELLEAKKALIGSAVDTRRHRVERYYALRRINEQMQPFVENLKAGLVDERARILSDLKKEAVIRSREYALVVHSEARLRSVLTNLSGGIIPVPKN